MKLTAPRDSFVTALQHAGRAVSARSTLPSLGGILFTAEGDSLTLRATDMEMGIALTLSGINIERDGTVLLPGRLLVDVARSLPAGDVSLELRSEQRDVELTAGDARFHLKTLPAEDFPRLPEVEGEAATLPAGPLAETIDRVARAASRDEVRPILTGVLVQAEGEKLTMVATDSYRLSVKHTELETPLAQPLDANVPARALRELARLVGTEGPETVDIDVSRNQAIFRIDGVATADAALEHFYDDVRPDLEELTRSEITRLGAPSGRFVSVAGSEYTATSAGQQGTTTMSGSIIAAVRADGTAVVLTTSRSGSSSPAELAGDGQLLTAILAHL